MLTFIIILIFSLWLSFYDFSFKKNKIIIIDCYKMLPSKCDMTQNRRVPGVQPACSVGISPTT